MTTKTKASSKKEKSIKITIKKSVKEESKKVITPKDIIEPSKPYWEDIRSLLEWVYHKEKIDEFIAWKITMEELKEHKIPPSKYWELEKVLDEPMVLTKAEENAKVESEPVGDKLTRRQEMFCQLYATEKEFLGNWVQSYLEVYNIDRSKKWWYDTACICASQLLSNPKVYTRINDLLTLEWFNDQNVDKQLLHLINQHAEWSSKLWAIREYNKIKQRITDKIKDESESDKAKTELYKEIHWKVKTMGVKDVSNIIQDLLT